MLQSETITTARSESGNGICPLIISDADTVRRYCPSFRHLLFGFEAQDISSAMVVPPASEIESFLFPRVRIVEHPVLKFPFFFFQNHRHLLSSLEKIKPSLVHCYGTAKAPLASSVAAHFDIPAVITIDSARFSIRSKMTINKNFNKILVPSNRLTEKLTQRGLSLEKISQVNIGTFADESCCCYSDTDRLPSMLVLGNFDRFSDYEPLLGAIRHLNVDGYEFLVIFMGSGPAETQIRNFIKSTGLIQTVTVTPLIRPLREVFRGCDVFIHPCSFGDFDPALIETAAAGLAIAADKDNAEEFLQDGSTSVLFDGNDELSIYSVLQKLLDDKLFARSIASAAQNYLRSNNSVSSMVNELLKIYESAKQH
ncbi:MAG: glycosyltransferase [Planctomycetes bacterium]|nr:glycosyltransferase [Planctomycetota bacterium]MBU1517361.1 glycosyltransferase [Planctomycetota bacterium]MBU2457680.1 glycosyltransferase [Planctomycetota bacterium]